jgi:hypothetical protein
MAKPNHPSVDLKSVAEYGAIFLGVGLGALGLIINTPALSIVGFSSSIIAFSLVERLSTREIRRDFVRSYTELVKRLDRIDYYVKATRGDDLTVAVFDAMLINLPLYVADHLKYFEQEGISVKFVPKYSDDAVARDVAQLEAEIGICDPCMCARMEFHSRDRGLHILAPIFVRNAAMPVTRNALKIQSSLIQGGSLTVATFPPPSTTYVMAVALRERLLAYGAARRLGTLDVSLIPKDPSYFNDAARLSGLLESHDLVMLWEPYLTMAKEKRENDVFVLGEDVSREATDEVMYSSVLISRRLLDEKPTLALRLYRALSRATHRIYLAGLDPRYRGEVMDAARSQVSITLSDEKFAQLICKTVEYGLIPLIERTEQLQERPWRGQLYRALVKRERARGEAEKIRRTGRSKSADVGLGGEFEEKVVEVRSENDCAQFFCPPEAFLPPGIVKGGR